MKYRNLPENPTGDPDIFLPFSERQRTFALVVRSAGNPAKLGEAVRRAVREADRTAVIYRMQTLEELASRETAQSRFTGWLMGIFAVAALALAVVGIYGVMSYSVMRRTQEIGIRMALGAARGDVMRMILRGGMLLAGSGLLLGLGAAAGLVRGMETLLWGVRPLDPVAFVAAALALGVTALAACLIPAARATRVAPSQALRNE
jgi:ABC-type antimicrobial peptide transport system permease subunit